MKLVHPESQVALHVFILEKKTITKTTGKIKYYPDFIKYMFRVAVIDCIYT